MVLRVCLWCRCTCGAYSDPSRFHSVLLPSPLPGSLIYSLFLRCLSNGQLSVALAAVDRFHLSEAVRGRVALLQALSRPPAGSMVRCA